MMRLWNRKPEVPQVGTPHGTPKRRLRESNSIEEAREAILKSPKPSAKAKKMDEHPRKFSQLVQNHDTRSGERESKKGKTIQGFLNIWG